jgi:hypothetical protein
MGTENEGKCLDAVLKIIEGQRGSKRQVLERDAPATRGIELLCDVGGQQYAMEHTLIEPFPDNKRDDVAFTKVLGNIELELKGVLRPDLIYSVWVDVYAFRDKKTRELERIRQALVLWLQATIPTIVSPSEYEQSAIRARPPHSPVHVMLSCRRTKNPGPNFFSGRFSPPDLDELRKKRMLKALNDKSPKLHAAKQKGKSTRTVLVLENQDIALTNESLVSETLESLSNEVRYMPDDIYLVGTYLNGRF